MTQERPDLRQRYRLPSRSVAHLFEDATTEGDYYEPDLAGIGYVEYTYRPLCFELTRDDNRYLVDSLVSDAEAPECHRCTIVARHIPSRPAPRTGKWCYLAWRQGLDAEISEADRAREGK